MNKLYDTSTIDCILDFSTAALLSCLRACLSVCLCLSWSHTFWTKINRIYKREFSGVSSDTSPIFDPRTSTSNLLNKRDENLHQFVQKMGEKNENKNNRCCKVLYVNRQTQNLAKGFENICILITSIQPQHFLN